MNKYKKIVLGLILAGNTMLVHAAAFQLQEQSAAQLGLAYSGTAALAQDATIGYYNAAGLTYLPESQLVISAVLAQTDMPFTAQSSNVSLLPNVAVPGALSVNPAKNVVIPTFHLAKRLDERWVLGMNVTTPFGLLTDYAEDSVARYMATRSKLHTINLSPSLGYQVFRCLSLGAGVDAQYLKAHLDTRIGNGQAALDGFQKNQAQGWGYGWHAGLLWAPFAHTQVGLHYRAKVNITAEGTSENLISNATIGGAPLLPRAGTYFLEQVQAKVVLPETATVSLLHAFHPKWLITADAAWTNWKRFHTLKLRFQPTFPGITSGPALNTDTWEHFKETWRYALGLTYQASAAWKWRLGTAIEATPTQAAFRTARIPDQARFWLALGAGWAPSKQWRLDFGYAHLFFKDAFINESAPYQANTQTPASFAALQGSYHPSANLLGIQMRYDFV